MPMIERNGTRLYYEDTGTGDETILFSHSLLWDTRVFGPQIAALASRYRCVAYDHRGQGRSDVPSEATIPMDLLTLDAAKSVTKAVNGVVQRGSFADQLKRITAPTLVIVGEEDVATTADKAHRMTAAIPDARLVHVPQAGHTSPIEQPDAVTIAIEEFLTGR